MNNIKSTETSETPSPYLEMFGKFAPVKTSSPRILINKFGENGQLALDLKRLLEKLGQRRINFIETDKKITVSGTSLEKGEPVARLYLSPNTLDACYVFFWLAQSLSAEVSKGLTIALNKEVLTDDPVLSFSDNTIILYTTYDNREILLQVLKKLEAGLEGDFKNNFPAGVLEKNYLVVKALKSFTLPVLGGLGRYVECQDTSSWDANLGSVRAKLEITDDPWNQASLLDYKNALGKRDGGSFPDRDIDNFYMLKVN